MTPELIELARAAMALPGASRAPRAIDRYRKMYAGAQLVTFRGPDGIQWVRTESADPEWLPNLTDPATGGVLVAMLGFEARQVRATNSMIKHAAGFPWGAEIETDAFLVPCQTQAEAACRVAVDIGGWK